jgi:hypothetical protein
MACAKHVIKLLAIPHDPSLGRAVSIYAPGIALNPYGFLEKSRVFTAPAKTDLF